MLIEKKNKHNINCDDRSDNLKHFGAWTLVIQMQQAAKIMMKR